MHKSQIASAACGVGLLLCGVGDWLRAADTNSRAPGKRIAVAALATDTGTLLRREASDKSWQVVAQKEKLCTGDLMIGFPGAQADTLNGSVRITFLTDLDADSPYPIAENALILRESAGDDLVFDLDRGRVDLVNRKLNGSARVRVHCWKEEFELTLTDPGTDVALELYGRWPAGVPFNRDSKANDLPVANLIVLVRKGQIRLKHGAFEYGMAAPPGPALIEWDSATGLDSTPRRLEQLPPWAADSPTTTAGQAKKAVLDRFRETIIEKSVGAALDEFVGSEDPRERALAVRAMGAFDDLPRLANALRDAKRMDVWDNGVLALRHWIGRGPGQDQLLFQGMTQSSNFSTVEAETIMQLLHSYGESDLAQPETYETLIAYLNHDKLAVRGLAHWHLIRLVPPGKAISYNPMDAKKKRAAAVDKWKELVPAGMVPPRPRPTS